MAGATLEQRVTALENAMADLRKLPGELALFREKVTARLDGLDARLDGLDTRLDNVERRISDEAESLYARMRLLQDDPDTSDRVGGVGACPTSGHRNQRA